MVFLFTAEKVTVIAISDDRSELIYDFELSKMDRQRDQLNHQFHRRITKYQLFWLCRGTASLCNFHRFKLKYVATSNATFCNDSYKTWQLFSIELLSPWIDCQRSLDVFLSFAQTKANIVINIYPGQWHIYIHLLCGPPLCDGFI